MCSIAGVIAVSNVRARGWRSKENDLKSESHGSVPPHIAVERMVEAQIHRGPDDRGVANFQLRNTRFDDASDSTRFETHVALGNTRLAILDLSAAGHQPMRDEVAGLTITYNGEVYNFRKLRSELGQEFGTWRSDTDTEVVLHAYRKWGTEAFHRLRGMFALAIWDECRGELILARDPFGIKPLYYSPIRERFHHGDIEDTEFALKTKSAIRNPQLAIPGFIFASEVRALLASGLIPRELDRLGLESYLEYGSVQAPLTIINEVRSLMPGHFLRISAGDGRLNTEERSYLRPSVFAAPAPGEEPEECYIPEFQGTGWPTQNVGSTPGTVEIPHSRSDAVVILREKLEHSLRAHLVSDVPLGVFLSGGIDSSALVALLTSVNKEAPKTFSVVFDEHQFSEAPHSRLIANQFKTDHKELRLTEDSLLEMLPRALASLDQPTIDGINTYVVSRAVKEAGVTVALSGLGGDELFAGYPTFRRALRMNSLSTFSKRLLRSASGISRGASVPQKKFWQLAASDGSPQAVYTITRQLFPRDGIQSLLANSHDDARFIEGFQNTKSAIGNPQFAIPQDPVNAISCLELHGYMANTLLRDTDCMSMAHSLEVRVPFIDVEIVRFVLSLPGKWKTNGFNRSRPKPMLSEAIDDLLPRELLQRPKMGFTLPFERWIQSRLRREISNVLENETCVAATGLNAQKAASIWRRFLQSPRSVGWSRPWALFVLAKWCAINGVRFANYATYSAVP